MTKNEEFERWAIAEGRSIKPASEYSPSVYASAATNNALDGWEGRQPEIDALKQCRDLAAYADVADTLTIVGQGREIRKLKASVAALKTEVERLRADAEMLDWLADPKNTIGNVQLPTHCVLNNLHSLRDAIIDAMKESK